MKDSPESQLTESMQVPGKVSSWRAFAAWEMEYMIRER
ncbi:hypothetical protein GBAR_LOCUS23613 [Geodia barretti]|uniref:Uncharacterized protein n=1 Tax=Geodia barretti TaxID=519541 RepID=A0AA35T7U7_GEOBA|nr:hypothetical protein GBAR_LOCUS23613 [Geodia barretti]